VGKSNIDTVTLKLVLAREAVAAMKLTRCDGPAGQLILSSLECVVCIGALVERPIDDLRDTPLANSHTQHLSLFILSSFQV